MKIKMLIIMLSAGLIIAAAAGQAQAKSYDVSIKNNAYAPRELTVSAGDTVTWTNNDAVVHNVDLDDLGKSPDMHKGDTFTKMFATPGTYSYDCDIHPSMTGKMIVK